MCPHNSPERDDSAMPFVVRTLEYHINLHPDQLAPENLELYRRVCGKPLVPEHTRRAASALGKLFGQPWRPLLEECARLGLDPSGTLSPKYLPELPESEMVWVIIFVSSWLHDVDQDAVFTVAQGIVTALRHRFPPTRLAFMLRNRLKNVEGGVERDWHEIAITVSHRLAGAGRLSTVPDRSYLLGQSYPSACEDCRRLVHGRVFQKIEPPGHAADEQRLHAIWIGKSNHGLEREDWRACIVLHPECRCWFNPLNPEHWWVSDNGRMQPRVGQEAAYKRWRESQWFDREQKDDTRSTTRTEPFTSGQLKADRGRNPDQGGGVTELPNGPSHRPVERGEVQQLRGEAEQLHRDLPHGLLDCLDYSAGPDDATQEHAYREWQGAQLVGKLDEFGIHGQLAGAVDGPVFSRFEFRLAPGCRIDAVKSILPDIQMALRAEAMHFLPAILGKAGVGFDVLNRNRKTVWLRDLLPSASLGEGTSRLQLPIGVDVAGAAFAVDLLEHPHLFIQGASGSGKSALLHAMIASLICRASPREVRLLMVDPGRLELSTYNPLPHLLGMVTTNPARAVRELGRIVDIMQRRYSELANIGVRDIVEYNSCAEKDGVETKPHILVVIDDLSFLLLGVPSELQERLVQITLHGDRVGIHLLVAASPPLPKGIANWVRDDFTTRASLWVEEKADSDTILDVSGAELLLRYGDMLLVQPGLSGPVRLHTPWVPEQACARLVQSWTLAYVTALLTGLVGNPAECARNMARSTAVDVLYDREKSGPPAKLNDLRTILPDDVIKGLMARQYYEPLPEQNSVEMAERHHSQDEGRKLDEKFAEAALIVVRHREASVSTLQRRLDIGWARAGRVIDQLEQAGIVGPYVGSKSREVLVDNETNLQKMLPGIGCRPRQSQPAGWLARLLGLPPKNHEKGK